MNRLRALTALTALVVVLAASQWCFAESNHADIERRRSVRLRGDGRAGNIRS
jgi:hypothetical protein